jgi:hypothetical protein
MATIYWCKGYRRDLGYRDTYAKRDSRGCRTIAKTAKTFNQLSRDGYETILISKRWRGRLFETYVRWNSIAQRWEQDERIFSRKALAGLEPLRMVKL